MAKQKLNQKKPVSSSVSGHVNPSFGLSNAELEPLLELLKKFQVSEFEWDRSEGKVKLRVGNPPAVVHSQTVPVQPVFQNLANQAPTSGAIDRPIAEPSAAQTSTQSSGKGKQITSPFVGTFYRSASPTGEPYVREGQTVKRGDVLCIVEAMKLMNQIEAEVAGKITSILVENGQPVEFGEPLFQIEPTA